MIDERTLLSARTLAGDRVLNLAGENLGKIEDFMLDLESGRIPYAVLSFGGVSESATSCSRCRPKP